MRADLSRRGAALAVVASVVAAMVVAAPPSAGAAPTRPLTVVILGDSYSAGEGLGADFGLTPGRTVAQLPDGSRNATHGWTRELCQRSTRAWGPVAGSVLPAGSRLVHAACTGATTGSETTPDGDAGAGVDYGDGSGGCTDDPTTGGPAWPPRS